MAASAGAAWQTLMQTSAAQSRLKTWTCGGQRSGWYNCQLTNSPQAFFSFFFFKLPLPICWQEFCHLCPHRDHLGCGVCCQAWEAWGLGASKYSRMPGTGQDLLEHRACKVQGTRYAEADAPWGPRHPIIQYSYRLLGPDVLFFPSILVLTWEGGYLWKQGRFFFFNLPEWVLLSRRKTNNKSPHSSSVCKGADDIQHVTFILLTLLNFTMQWH